MGPGSSIPPSELSGPPEDGLFSVVENLAAIANWGAGNPLAFRTGLEPTAIHREEIQVRQPDGTVDTHAHKFRGVYGNATIAEELVDDDGDEDDSVLPDTPRVREGIYKFTLTGFSMPQHSQAVGPGHRVEFSGRVLRVHTAADPTGPRKELKVMRTQHIGTGNDLVVYAVDTGFVENPIPLGVHLVNYYPGYRAYLFADAPQNLTQANTLPAGDQFVRYTIFGLRCLDAGLGYFSGVSLPALMFAQAVTEPERPRLPIGGTYATRPDFYGKSTFTFTTVFEHQPGLWRDIATL